jgi:hypothetical protein
MEFIVSNKSFVNKIRTYSILTSCYLDDLKITQACFINKKHGVVNKKTQKKRSDNFVFFYMS